MLKIFSIIVTYNPEITDLRNQLQFLKLSKVEIIVVDNFSINLSVIKDCIRDLNFHDKIKLISNNENLGLSIAQNIGIKYAIKMNATHCVLFDQDSIPIEGFFNKILADEKYLQSKNILFSAIGPNTFDPISMQRYPITKYIGPFIKRKFSSGIHPIEATFIIASGSLIRVDTLKKIGLMNDELFIDYIDVEWCLRARSKGYHCFVSSTATMSHRVGDNRVTFLWRTISAHSPLRRYYLMRNSFYICRLSYIPLSYKIREVSLNLIRFLTFYILSRDKKNYLKYTKKAILDGWNARYGKMKE